MTRRAPAVLCLLLPLVAPAAAAQSISWNFETSDTALVVPIGQTRTIRLYASVTGGVSSYTIRVFLDDARVRIVDVDSVPGYGLPSPTITPGTNEVTLSATGTGSSGSLYLARVFVEMDAAAVEGSLLSFTVDQLLNQAGATFDLPNVGTDILNVCQSRAVWGDPDSSLTITGRDALIVLTYAVQLPVTGFGVALGDVDGDTQVTSRDALIILSNAIGADVYYYYRTGVAIANRCAPLTGVPSDFAFLRSGTPYRVPAGDSVAVPLSSSTNFYPSHGMRWAPDGSRVIGTEYTPTYYYEPVSITLATLAHDTLSRNGAYDGGASYSPTGAQVAFLRTSPAYHIWVMNAADGSGQTDVTSAGFTAMPSVYGNASWKPDGSRIAVQGYTTCCVYGLWTIRMDSLTVREEFPGSGTYGVRNAVWSPAGDSLLFHNGSGRLYVVASPDTATVPRRVAARYAGGQDWPSWTSAGILFRWGRGNTYDYYVRQPSGRILRVYRAAGTGDVGGSFR